MSGHEDRGQARARLPRVGALEATQRRLRPPTSRSETGRVP